MRKINVEFQNGEAVDLNVRRIDLAKLYFVLGYIDATLHQINKNADSVRAITLRLSSLNQKIRREIEDVKDK